MNRTGVVTITAAGILAAGAAVADGPNPPAAKPVPERIEYAEGPFKADDESFKQYRCPDWFRDAKFGIWSHWGPQAVPMAGDWYAKHTYVQGHGQYQHHLENYGHPSTNGWKDMIPRWKAEKWDPERLMELYARAGARYFVSMACHHDNYDLWKSTYHRWNAVNIGPERDVVGDWQKAARKFGLKFGVSEHMGASFTWFQTSKGADKTGPLAGVPYDGTDPRYFDLYHPPAKPGDTEWYSKDPDWHREWFWRIRDLIDQYHPDLLYTDGGMPFGNDAGRRMIAHYYNTDAARNGGTPQAVYTCKQTSEGKWVQDLERGVMSGINPHPWQTDTSIGDWYYNKNWKYRGTDWTVHMLVDIVSKNGNLLLNVVQRPDGTLDPEAEQNLVQLAAWMKVNAESIYGTRPWLVHGEGPVRAKGGHFKEDFAYSAKDIRFVTRGAQTLYATALGWPEDRNLRVRSLARLPGVEGRITGVKLLGYGGDLKWSHTEEGLAVDLPAEKPCAYTCTLKILCDDVTAFDPLTAAKQWIPAVQAGPDGSFVLQPDDAELHGGLHTENQGGQPNIGFWDRSDDWASWQVKFPAAGSYDVTAECAAMGEVEFAVSIGDRRTTGRTAATGAWDAFKAVPAGRIEVSAAGVAEVAVKPADAASWKAINLRRVILKRAAP